MDGEDREKSKPSHAGRTGLVPRDGDVTNSFMLKMMGGPDSGQVQKAIWKG